MMKRFILFFLLLRFTVSFAQQHQVETILKDKISIRAIQLWNNRVYYAGTDSKFGYVSLKNPAERKQIVLSDKKLQFRTLAQNKKAFYTVNIESPAYFFRINKKDLSWQTVASDTAKTAFYDAVHFHDQKFYAFSDPEEDLAFKLPQFSEKKGIFNFRLMTDSWLLMKSGEAAFAASNTNISSSENYVWVATGGSASRIFRLNLKSDEFEIFKTPFVQGKSSQGIYSIDFYKDQFGIAVGGDYTVQEANLNNIATTYDAGKTWQIQASGKNAGYSTCVKIRPGSKGKDIIAVGDRHISLSQDFGKTWKVISEEKGFYACAWKDRNILVLAGKDRIATIKMF